MDIEVKTTNETKSFLVAAIVYYSILLVLGIVTNGLGVFVIQSRRKRDQKLLSTDQIYLVSIWGYDILRCLLFISPIILCSFLIEIDEDKRTLRLENSNIRQYIGAVQIFTVEWSLLSSVLILVLVTLNRVSKKYHIFNSIRLPGKSNKFIAFINLFSVAVILAYTTLAVMKNDAGYHIRISNKTSYVNGTVNTEIQLFAVLDDAASNRPNYQAGPEIQASFYILTGVEILLILMIVAVHLLLYNKVTFDLKHNERVFEHSIREIETESQLLEGYMREEHDEKMKQLSNQVKGVKRLLIYYGLISSVFIVQMIAAIQTESGDWNVNQTFTTAIDIQNVLAIIAGVNYVIHPMLYYLLFKDFRDDTSVALNALWIRLGIRKRGYEEIQ